MLSSIDACWLLLISTSIIPMIIWLVALVLGLFKSPFHSCDRPTDGLPHALSIALLLSHACQWKHLPQLWHSFSSKGSTPSFPVGWFLLRTHSTSLLSLCLVHTQGPFLLSFLHSFCCQCTFTAFLSSQFASLLPVHTHDILLVLLLVVSGTHSRRLLLLHPAHSHGSFVFIVIGSKPEHNCVVVAYLQMRSSSSSLTSFLLVLHVLSQQHILLVVPATCLVAFSFKEFLFSSFFFPFGPYFLCSCSCRKMRKHDSEHFPCFPAPEEAWLRSE